MPEKSIFHINLVCLTEKKKPRGIHFHADQSVLVSHSSKYFISTNSSSVYGTIGIERAKKDKKERKKKKEKAVSRRWCGKKANPMDLPIGIKKIIQFMRTTDTGYWPTFRVIWAWVGSRWFTLYHYLDANFAEGRKKMIKL